MAEQQNEQDGVENQEAQPETMTPSENTLDVAVNTDAPAEAPSEVEATPEETTVSATATAPAEALDMEPTEEQGMLARLAGAAGALAHQVQDVVGGGG